MKSSTSSTLFALFAVSVLCVGGVAVVFGFNENQHPSIYGTVIGTEPGYGSPVFSTTYEDFTDAGYKYGDTFDVMVDGVVLHDAILTQSYMGLFMFDTYINVNLKMGGITTAGSMWNTLLPVNIGSTVVFKYTGTNDDYLKLRNYLVKETDNIRDYGNDPVVFGNFNEITAGNIKAGKLYSSFAPFGDKNRNKIVDGLAKDKGIAYDIALSFTDRQLQAMVDAGKTGHCLDLFKSGKVSALGMGYRYFIQTEKIKAAFEAMAENNGPYLIHCNAGRDRSGFMVTLISALCGATEEQMVEQAAKPYVKLYHVVPGSEECKVIMKNTYYRNMYFIQNYDRIDDLLVGGKLPIDWSDKSVSGIDTQKAARNFCINYIGISESTLNQVISKLCTN